MDVPYERDADIMVCLRGISIATITPEDYSRTAARSSVRRAYIPANRTRRG